MYLLDNTNNSITWDNLKNIYDDITDINQIRDEYFLKNSLNQILYNINTKNKFVKSESTLNNFKNLFKNEPLNLNENEINDIFSNLNINLSFISKNNSYNFTPIEVNKIFEKYNNLIIDKIKTLKDTTSYDIVGMIHKSIKPLCYGKEIYNKKDMDSLLYFINSKNINNINNNINDEIKNEILELINKTFNNDFDKEKAIYFLNENNINETMTLISNQITNIDKNSFKNANREKLKEYSNIFHQFNYQSFSNSISQLRFDRNSIGFKVQQDILNMITNGFNRNDLYTYLLSLTDELKNNQDYLNQTISGFANLSLNKDIKQNLISNIKKEIHNIEELQSNLISIIDFQDNVKNFGLKNYMSNIRNLYKNYLNERDIAFVDFKKIKEKNETEYHNILQSYQSINKKLLYNKDYFENHINKNGINTLDIKDKFQNNLYEILKIKDISKYKLEDVKQLYLLINSDNKTIYNLFKTTELLKNIDKNLLFQNIFNNKYKEIDIEIYKRIKYLYDVLILKNDIKKLLEKDITIDIEKLLFKSIKHYNAFSKESLEFINQKFNELKDTNIFKNKPNLLYGLIIFSSEYSDINKQLEFNNDKFNNFKLILQTNKTDIFKNNDLIDSLNSINDNWLKWSLVYNREIKDVQLTEIGIDIKSFDFASFNDTKKLITDYQINNLNNQDFKFDNNFYHVLEYYKLFDNELNFDKIINIYKHFNSLPDKMQNYFIGSCKHIIDISQSDFFKTYYKNDIAKNINNLYKFIDSTIKTNYFENKFKNTDYKKDFIYIYREILNKEIGDKNYKNAIKDLNNLELLFEKNLKFDIKSTIDVMKKLDKNYIKKTVEYYIDNYKKHNIENFNIESSQIPLISKNINDKYSYRVLTIKDYDILLAGQKTNCCMSLGGAGWNIYKHMFENPKSSMLFEVYRNGVAVANSWLWKNGNQLTFDNIETLDSSDILRNDVKKAYLDYSIRAFIENNDINHITYGLGNGDVTNLGIKYSNFKTLPNYRNYYSYNDSLSQNTIIADKNKLSNDQISCIIKEAELLNVDQELINKFKEKLDLEIQDNNHYHCDNC